MNALALHEAAMQMILSGIEYEAALQAFERQFIILTLDRCKGNQCKAAELMKVHRNTLRRKMAELSIPNQWKAKAA